MLNERAIQSISRQAAHKPLLVDHEEMHKGRNTVQLLEFMHNYSVIPHVCNKDNCIPAPLDTYSIIISSPNWKLLGIFFFYNPCKTQTSQINKKLLIK